MECVKYVKKELFYIFLLTIRNLFVFISIFRIKNFKSVNKRVNFIFLPQ